MNQAQTKFPRYVSEEHIKSILDQYNFIKALATVAAQEYVIAEKEIINKLYGQNYSINIRDIEAESIEDGLIYYSINYSRDTDYCTAPISILFNPDWKDDLESKLTKEKQDKEMKARQDKEDIKNFQEAQEKETYLRLKKKYEAGQDK